jgi:hypothetical protein
VRPAAIRAACPYATKGNDSAAPPVVLLPLPLLQGLLFATSGEDYPPVKSGPFYFFAAAGQLAGHGENASSNSVSKSFPHPNVIRFARIKAGKNTRASPRKDRWHRVSPSRMSYIQMKKQTISGRKEPDKVCSPSH